MSRYPDSSGPVRIVIEDPDGNLHGEGDVIASAHASSWRWKDIPPRLRPAIWREETNPLLPRRDVV